jgi:hypothetical protein
MGRFYLTLVLALIFGAGPVQAHLWEVTSPDQRQTFAYGSERHRQWIARGNHLGIVMHFTNDPYVDQVNFRQYDDFDFEFPNITRATDGRTFFYHPRGHQPVAVATAHAGLFGTGVTLLPSSCLAVQKIHGLLTLTLIVSDSTLRTADAE